MRWLWAVSALVVVAACGDPPPPSATRGPGNDPLSSTPESALPPPPGSAPATPAGGSRHRLSPRPMPPPLPSTRAGGGGGARAAEATGPTDAELRGALTRAFGAPTSCISEEARDAIEGTLTVQVSVVLTAEGRVTRGDVSAPHLSRDDLECMRRHAEGLHFINEVPDAPRTVTASIEYQIHETPGEAHTELPPVVRGPGRLAPDTTLPAGGTETERPNGFVSPTSTLPSQNPSNRGPLPGRPSGFVAPSSTLPARVP